ncbi:MAG: glycosyltransferase family 4 protein, partial [Ignavibacteriales bacterium]
VALVLFRMVLAGRARRLVGRRRPQRSLRRVAIVLSRQRIVGRTNGSSAYLLSIVSALKARGWSFRFIGPSPHAFGRWPVVRLKREMDVFDSVRLRGSVALGRWRVATSLTTWGRAFVTVIERLLAKAGIKARGWVKPAPYAVAQPAKRGDVLYVARHAPVGAAAVLADYAFLTPLIPYALNPEARSAVIMHDLFSARPPQFAKAGEADSVAQLDLADEIALLGEAQAVVAIQAAEADVVRRRLPGREVLLAPMTAEPVGAPAPGDSRRLLFVGSNTAPNVIGLKWFFRDVWPSLRADRPELTLDILGNINRAFDAAPAGVRLRGPVGDLRPWYARAGVVIAPLTVGSGLKIKLIEALAEGKAVVGTSVAAQGVEELVANCIVIADDPARFAKAVLALSHDPDRRRALAAAGLARIRRSFSPEAGYEPLMNWLDTGPVRTAVSAAAPAPLRA